MSENPHDKSQQQKNESSSATPLSTLNVITAAPGPQTPWSEAIFVSFDTETTGKYPLTAEVCELSAVKWRGDEIIATFSTLLKPTYPMRDEVIAIHGITNEMVAKAPTISEKIAEFRSFLDGAVAVAHHAPFDLGFMSLEFEKAGFALPSEPAICSSLLSRKVLPESPDHRLQTLIQFLQLPQGQAHRALDDAKACWQVTLRSMQKLGNGPLSSVFDAQGGTIWWSRFSMRALEESDSVGPIVQASREQREIDFVYVSGSKKGQTRRVLAVGVVRSLDGDFFVGAEPGTTQTKRYFLNKVISSTRVV